MRLCEKRKPADCLTIIAFRTFCLATKGTPPVGMAAWLPVRSSSSFFGSKSKDGTESMFDIFSPKVALHSLHLSQQTVSKLSAVPYLAPNKKLLFPPETSYYLCTVKFHCSHVTLPRNVARNQAYPVVMHCSVMTASFSEHRNHGRFFSSSSKGVAQSKCACTSILF